MIEKYRVTTKNVVKQFLGGRKITRQDKEREREHYIYIFLISEVLMALRIRKKLFHHIFCSHPVGEPSQGKEFLRTSYLSGTFGSFAQNCCKVNLYKKIPLNSVAFAKKVHNESE